MKQTLQLKLTQHLTLTPQLQQSIRLLQLSTVELNAEVDRMLQENPLLEKADGDDEVRHVEPPLAGPARASEVDALGTAPSGDDRPDAGERAEGPAPAGDERPDRSEFEDYGRGDSDWGGSGSGNGSDDDDGLYPQQVALTTLRDHLYSQLSVLNLPLRDRQVVVALIDDVDEDGYLAAKPEELTDLFPEEFAIEPEEISIAMRFLQSFEPAGVGARNAAECLALQLKTLPESTPYLQDAIRLVTEHLPLLAVRDFTRLKRLPLS